MIAPARRAAYEALQAVTRDALELPAALAASRDPLRDARDRALAGEIVIGVLRWRAALDAIAGTLTRRTVTGLDPEVLDILRMGIYQLWHLRRVPASAVVNDAVELTRIARRGRASALVNAALRGFGRTDPLSALPARPADPGTSAEAALDYLSVTLSHPRWLVARLLARHGFESAERWARFNNAPAPLTLRVNTAKTSLAALEAALRSQDFVVERASVAPGALIARERNPLGTRQFSAGEFIVQEEASQLVAHLAGARPGERILDACASPGGKTVVLSSDAGGDASITAADVRLKRIDLLRKTLARTGVRAEVLQLDLRRPLLLDRAFDCVLVDAPCSGLGTVRRDPDIKWRRAERDLVKFAAVQAELLRNASAVVQPGGRLVYATCSSEPEENDAVVDAFLAEPRGYSPATRDQLSRNPHWDRLSRVCDHLGRLRTLPHEHGLEAFFGAVLVKAEGV